MRRVAVFVDAGYFWVQAVKIAQGEKMGRESITLNYPVLRNTLLQETKNAFPEASLLRIYWYDGPHRTHGKSREHKAIEELDDFKLRLGSLNGVGEQKAVDGLIIADMIGLAQSRVITDALLVSGDADLTPGVLAAQNLGVRVHLLSMGPPEATSPYLKAEVDCKFLWRRESIMAFAAPVTVKSPTIAARVSLDSGPPAAGPESQTTDTLASVALDTFTGLSEAEKAQVSVDKALPALIDRKLLKLAADRLRRLLTEDEKRMLRARMKDQSKGGGA
ncbi:hypothetical protein C4901_09355 [Acidiferrobacter sp. SPIII_3]|uniref:NYN domain-containing protein n=1 Tax=Acidiferrobacter sp. SPIII_3 TaxID=1281578 RepID=UPI000D72E925|nr:hypothetical protein C4901_09355 [Acidiferrobacter sp. SPIII_3]